MVEKVKRNNQLLLCEAPKCYTISRALQPTHEFLSHANRTQEEVEEEVDWENAAAHVYDQDDEDTE